ncbi:hypothetical protein PCE1_003791 [Barthelona sp. PCE]
MSTVEETLARIQNHPGVLGYIIINSDGAAVRRFGMDLEEVARYSQLIMNLAAQGRSAVRDLDPRNDLNFIRIRSNKHEIMIAPEIDYTLVVIQDPTAEAV